MSNTNIVLRSTKNLILYYLLSRLTYIIRWNIKNKFASFVYTNRTMCVLRCVICDVYSFIVHRWYLYWYKVICGQSVWRDICWFIRFKVGWRNIYAIFRYVGFCLTSSRILQFVKKKYNFKTQLFNITK